MNVSEHTPFQEEQFDFIWFRDAPIDNKKRYIDPSRLLRMSVMVSVAVSQVGMTELIDICQPWGEGERPVLLRCLAVSADASSNQTCHMFFGDTV